MDIFAFLVMAVMAIIFIALWFDTRSKAHAQQFKGLLDETVSKVASLEASVKALKRKSEGERKDNKVADKALTTDSICEALRHNGYSPELSDSGETGFVHFKINDTSFRLNTSHVPYLSLELGYVFDPSKEDLALMKLAADEITAGIFIGKVSILEDGKALIFTAEWICDSYLQFRDRINDYLEVVCEAYKRYADTYDKMREEKRKKEEELLTKPFSLTNDDNSGPKILS